MQSRSEIVIDDATGLDWAVGESFSLPDYAYQRLLKCGSIVNRTLVACSGITAHDRNTVRSQQAYTPQAPLSARLPLSYHWVPARLRSWLARRIGHKQRMAQDRWAMFPKWPLDLTSDILSDAIGDRSPWRDRPTPVALTHDLDSAEGLTNVVQRFLPMEERYGARSTNFIVPCGWSLDHQALQTIQRRGHELGIHGYDHSNRSPFLSPSARQKRLAKGALLANEYRMTGYRAPSLLRTEGLLADLHAHYQYDSSIPTSGGLFPVPNNGCASARPYWLQGLVEIPLSLPRDGSLLFLGYAPAEIARLWIACAERIARSGGVVVLLTHAEERFSGQPAMLEAYKQFLKHIAYSDQYRWATMDQVAAEFAASHRPIAQPETQSC